MEFQVMARELKELLKRTGNKNEHIAEAIRYKNENSRATIPVAHFKTEELKELVQVIDDRLKATPDDRHNKWVKGRLRAWFELHEGAIDSKTVVKKLENLVISLKRYLEETAPHRWVFYEHHDRISVPYFVSEIKYTKRKRDRSGTVYPAYVTMTSRAYSHGASRERSSRWSEAGWSPRTVPQLLALADVQVETPDAVAAYFEDMRTYGRYQSVCGLQTYAVGEALVAGKARWGGTTWNSSPMLRNGIATKVVLDPNSEELEGNKGDDESRVFPTGFWESVEDRNGLTLEPTMEVEDDDEEEPSTDIEVFLPLHPYLYAFDLDQHVWVDIHTQNLQEYPWDKKLLEKLILPEEQKQLLEILISTTHTQVDDIIRGKMSGVIVLATGKPGVGKTLTAEVFSEYIEKPLYTVQCSQLGLDVDTIEKNLQEILSRASRWGAVLLIDEADVYIRRRGEDIVQNAIVGVFLRLLEYYRGVLFMTSNRGNIVDDAILSRATAWLQYDLPTAELLTQIWKVLAAQYKVKLTGKDITTLVQKLSGISGRSVRNILKLASLLKGDKAGVADIINVSKYQALEGQHEE